MKRGFIQEVLHRLLSPWSWPFAGYLVIVTFFGGLGVFFTVYEVWVNEWCDSYKIAESLSTFFVAIVATSFIDLNLSEKLQNRLAFLIYSFIFSGASAVLLWLTYNLKSTASFIPSSLGTLFSLGIWVIANADNKKLTEENFFSTMRGENLDADWGSNN